MQKFKVENLYRTAITSSLGIAASGDVSFTVTTAPINTNGYIVISPDSTTLREIMYYHDVVGNTIYVRAENRISPKAHSKNETVQINDVAEIFNTYSDMISTCFYIEKTGGLNVKVWGGTVYYDGTPQTVADTTLTLTDNTTNYIKYDFATNTISGDTVNSGNIKATITIVGGIFTSIVYNVSKESYSTAGGGDMLKSDNLSGLSNYVTARSNLGLGSLATQSGTFSGTSSGTNTGDNAANTNSGLVHTTGTETIAGVKTFSSSPIVPAPSSGTDAVNKTYADSLVTGLLDYRGAYDASVNTFPASGGSGTAGAVMKGDMWIVSVAGTLGGTAVQIGDSLIASIDTPAQTAANWNILNSNISYVPEDIANKVTSISGASTNTQYPSAKLVYDQLALKAPVASPSFTGMVTSPNSVNTNNAITATANAATVPVTSKVNTVTNNSAATLTITLTTSGAIDGQMVLVRVLDFSAVAQTVAWVNTENGEGTAFTTSNGSTTLPRTAGFMYNSATSKWRCLTN